MSEPATTLAYTRATLAAPPGKDGPVEFVASQAKANRYGFALRPDGWLLDNFQANPVFLWMHNPSVPPIGRADARVAGGELRAAVTFDQGDELAQQVERKYRAGFLNAVSVGWGFVKADGSPINDWWRLTPEQIASKEVHYDLEEISGVSVPGDPRAVRKNQALALARIGRELLDLVDDPDDQERLASRVREEVNRQLDDALAGALTRLGITPTTLAAPAAATLEPSTTDPDPDRSVSDPPSAGGEPAAQFDPTAAQGLLAALAL
jgi:hypothetical protein